MESKEQDNGEIGKESDTTNQEDLPKCYELKSLGSDSRTTLVLSNTRELDRELFYKLVYLI